METKTSEAIQILRKFVERDEEANIEAIGDHEVVAIQTLVDHASERSTEERSEHFKRLLELVGEDPDHNHRRRMLEAALAFYGTE